MLRLRRLAIPAAIVSLVVGLGAVGAVASPSASPGGSNAARQDLQGTKPAWTAKATPSSVVSNSQSETARVWLAPQNAASLAALATAVSDPSSSQYGDFLSHDQYVAQFAPTAAQVASITSWLKQSNLTVTSVGPDNHFVSVSGTAAAMQTAFGAQLAVYQVNGTSQQAPTSDFTVPSSVAGLVQTITGLSTFGHIVSNDLSPETAFVNAQPCSAYYGQQNAKKTLPKFDKQVLPYAVCGYTPKQFRGAYGVDATGLNGAGQTVAITDAFDSPTLASDANQYASNHGDPTFGSGQFNDDSVPEPTDPTIVDECGGNGWYGEQTLDVEAVHGMATGANVDYYGAASCLDTDLLAALQQVVSDDKASIVTNSWGEPTIITNLPDDGCTPDTPCLAFDPGSVAAYEATFEQGAVEGIGFYFSSGDEGDEAQNSGFISPDWPAEDPLVTAVGGTSLAIDQNNNRQFETGWGTSKWSLSSDGTSWVQSIPFQYGAGGGYSLLGNVGLTGLWPNTAASEGQPFYQNGIVPDNQTLCPTDANDNPKGCRGVPDIAMDGDPTTGMLIGQTQAFADSSVFGPPGNHYGEYRVGGTSLASPLLAGAQADAQQGAGHKFGFANPLLYALKAKTRGQGTFYDPKGKDPDAGNIRSDYVNGENGDDGIVYSVRTFDQDSSLNTDKGWDQVTGIGTINDRYFKRVAKAVG